MNRAVVVVLMVLGVVVGFAAIVAGGYDDSPGLQLIGAAVVATAVALGVRTLRSRG